MEYPKILFKSGWSDLEDHKIVHDKEEEASARKEGFSALSEEKKKAKTEAK